MNLRHLTAALAALALAASAGCSLGDANNPPLNSGDGDGDGDGDTTLPDTEGAQTFSSDVGPLMARCAGAACHSGSGTAPLKFLGDDSTADDYSSITSYASVTGNFDPAVANLLLMVEPGDHYNVPDWSDTEKGLIVSWLMVERNERGLEPSEPIDPNPTAAPTNTRQALAQWAGCMTQANWDQANMGDWANKGSNEGPCRNCHNQGAYRYFANNDSTTMFNMNRTELYIIGFFKTSVADDGTVSVVPSVPKFERMGIGDASVTNHPEFNTSPDDSRFQSLQQFYELTQQSLDNGTCGPAEFYVP